jgi:secreted PhoX family phosphatase
MSRSFSELRQAFIRRRQFLLASAGAATLVHPLVRAAVAAPNRSMPGPGFEGISHRLDQDQAVARGYTAQVLLRWGDTLSGTASGSFPLEAARQQQCFGYNNDYVAYFPLAGSRRGLLCVNHEYTRGHLMFPGYRNKQQAGNAMTPAQTRSEMAAVGHSVIEVARTDAGWEVVPDSRYQRRLTPSSRMAVDGPAAGHKRLATRQDPDGSAISGTLACCAGGKTPWGTVLIAEENFSDFFSGHPNNLPSKETCRSVAQFPLRHDFPHWSQVDDRFHLNIEPNEFNRFGWVVELDPFDPTSTPVKHTALGRFEHEGATPVCKAGQPVVVYSGDDEENQFLYRFVSADVYRPGNGAANRKLLSRGTLYVARFLEDGSGEWVPLVHGSKPLDESNGFSSQADVMIDCRRAAALLGATPMDRPEDIESSPATDKVYVVLTKNSKKEGPAPANPRGRNRAGHIVEIIPPGEDGARDHTRDEFTWDILLRAGDPGAAGDDAGVYGGPLPASDWFANPDNLAFDNRHRLWVATDGCESFGFADGLWCTATEGSARALPRHFYRAPRGSEVCGPEFTPDGRSLFIAVQHPADESGSFFDKPSTRWPDFDPERPPRPSIVVITRDDGGLIGD